MIDVNRRVLPGYRLSLGYALTYLSLLVMVPIGVGVLKASSLSAADFWAAVSTERALAAYRLTIGASLAAAGVNVVLGVLVAWALVRYEFPLKSLLDALVDFPFALPTAVAGLTFSSLYIKEGWLGRFLVPLGIQVTYTRLGIVLVLVFVSFPFVVRALQPVLDDLDRQMEEASACLGATRWQTVTRVVLPEILPAVIAGFALAFARCLGEYGSVVFIAGNMPFRTEIAPVLIVSRLEEFAYAEATAIAIVLVAISLASLFLINLVERWSKRHHG